jgi:hypothetical protein
MTKPMSAEERVLEHLRACRVIAAEVSELQEWDTLACIDAVDLIRAAEQAAREEERHQCARRKKSPERLLVEAAILMDFARAFGVEATRECPKYGYPVSLTLPELAEAVKAKLWEEHRERCAAECDEQARLQHQSGNPIAAQWAAQGCARSIRAMPREEPSDAD